MHLYHHQLAKEQSYVYSDLALTHSLAVEMLLIPDLFFLPLALPTSEGGVSTAVIGGAAGAGVVVIAVVVLSLAAIACVLYRRSSHTKTTEYETFE